MLSNEQEAIIRQTVPLLEAGGEALPRHFYQTASQCSAYSRVAA